MGKRWTDNEHHLYDMDRDERDVFGDHEVADLMEHMIVFGGVSGVGYMTNPDTKNRPSFIEVNGQKVVCTAQGGECRYNHRYYSPGMHDSKSWTTPIIDRSCPNECGYKMLVCDEHGDHKNCNHSRNFYPQYNKFRGEFSWYCRTLELLEIKEA
jgi:hypothetical protein